MTCSNKPNAQIASHNGEKLSPLQQWKRYLHSHTCKTCRTDRAKIRQIEVSLQSLAEAPAPPHLYTTLLSQLPELSGADLPTSLHEDVVLDRNGSVRKWQQRRQRIILAGALLIVGALSIPMIPNLHYAAMVLMSGFWLRPARAKQIQEFMNPAIRDSSKYNARQLAGARELRALWKPQAMQNRQIIRLMLESDAHNETALRGVLSTLPVSLPEKGAGITHQLLYADNRQFYWSPGFREKGGLPNNAREDFARRHDIVLVCSDGYSDVHYKLWVSGRITADTYIPQYALFRGSQPSALLECEIVPPYEELTGNP